MSSKSSGISGLSRGGYAVCLGNEHYAASLEVGKIHRILRRQTLDPVAHIRVIDESGEDYIYPERRFEKVELSSRIRRALKSSATPT